MQTLKKPKPQSKPKKPNVLKESAEKMEMVFNEGHGLFTKLISVIPDGVVLADMHGKIIFINEFGVNSSGYASPSEIIGRNVLEFITLGQRKEAKMAMTERFKKGDVGTREYGLITKDGRLTPIEIKGDILKNHDGSPFAYVYIGRDLTERKKAEEAVIKSEQKYRAILDKAPDAVLIRNEDGNIVDANVEATKLFGYSKKELIGMHLSTNYPPEEVKRAQKAFASMTKHGKAFLDNTYALRKDGQKISVDVGGSCFSVGNEVLYKIIFHNMTEHRKMQEELKKAKTQLEATVVERTMELMEANTTLKVLLSHQNQEKAENEEKLFTNLRNQILPYIQELKKELSTDKGKAYLQLIEKNLQSVMSEFVTHLKSTTSKLTPKEIQVASLIKEGMSTKEIAQFLNVSRKTVDILRYNIRKKLGLNNRKESLMSHLLSL
jgi:PAS domain S-box-containing protein